MNSGIAVARDGVNCPSKTLAREASAEGPMIVKRLIFKKVLSSGGLAEFLLVKEGGRYEAALFINGKHVAGPSKPTPLDPPKGDLTHWMGNRPSVGLTQSEAERIMEEVEFENRVLDHRKKRSWDSR